MGIHSELRPNLLKHSARLCSVDMKGLDDRSPRVLLQDRIACQLRRLILARAAAGFKRLFGGRIGGPRQCVSAERGISERLEHRFLWRRVEHVLFRKLGRLRIFSLPDSVRSLLQPVRRVSKLNVRSKE